MTLRAAFRVAAWNALAILAVLLVAEAVFGGWFRGGGLGVLHVPRDVAIRHDVSKLRPGKPIAEYRRDQWGLRGDFGDPRRIDILAVGGSTTNELYHDETEIWTAVLQRRFAEAGRTVMVANAGVDGHSTVGHLRSMEAWFPRITGLKPKLVLFYVGVNDVYVEQHDRYDDILPKSAWERFRRYAGNNSALYEMVRTVRGMIRAERARVVYGHEAPKLHPVGAPPPLRRAEYAARLDAYASRIAALAAATRKLGARPVFVTQRRGDAFRVGGRWMATGDGAVLASEVQGLYNATLLDACRAAQAICIDLAAEIDLVPGEFYDSVHVTPAGSRKIGAYLYAKLKDAL